MTAEDRINALSKRFRRYAELECRGSSALYERLCKGISDDREVLVLAAETRRDQPAPNLLLAAVHMLLMSNPDHRLARFYPDLADGDSLPKEDPYTDFRKFCLEYSKEIADIISTRRVQTNVVERCAILLPAFAMVARKEFHRPLYMVEIGTSAGLNLLWNRFGYDYGEGRRYGDAESPVQLRTVFRGGARPQFEGNLPAVIENVGIELSPIELDDECATSWLKALVWPEHRDRFERLNAALLMARASPPNVLEGDAVKILPKMLAAVPDGSVVCVYHTHVTYQFTPEDRDMLDQVLFDFSIRNRIYRVSSEFRASVEDWLTIENSNQADPTLLLETYDRGSKQTDLLARVDPHGRWIEWLHSG